MIVLLLMLSGHHFYHHSCKCRQNLVKVSPNNITADYVYCFDSDKKLPRITDLALNHEPLK